MWINIQIMGIIIVGGILVINYIYLANANICFTLSLKMYYKCTRLEVIVVKSDYAKERLFFSTEVMSR
jgi:hypothetical protein